MATLLAWWLGMDWFGAFAAVWVLVMTAMACGLALRYATKLQGTDAVPRLRWRRTGDILVAIEVLVPTAAAVFILSARDHSSPDPFAKLEISTFALMLSVLLAFVFGSSLWDWWHVLPERDGVVRLPPCMSSGDPRWTDVTATWMRHRFFAEVAAVFFFFFFPAVLAAEIWYAEPGDLEWMTKTLSPVALILGWMFSFSKVRVPVGLGAIIETPPFALGDTLTWRVPRQVGAKPKATQKKVTVGPAVVDISISLGRWFRRQSELPSSNGENRYLLDVSLANATTIRLAAKRKGRLPATMQVPMRVLLFPGGIQDPQHISPCADASGCLVLHGHCERET